VEVLAADFLLKVTVTQSHRNYVRDGGLWRRKGIKPRDAAVIFQYGGRLPS